MYSELFSYLMEKDVKYKGNVNLSLYSYIKIGGTVDVGVFPDTKEKLVCVLRYLYKSDHPFFIVGNMTNLLPYDLVYSGVCVFTDAIHNYEIKGNLVKIDCGARLSFAIKKLQDACLGGLEPLFGIPGTVGGMIYSNAGAFGKEISDFLVCVTVYDVVQDKIYSLSKEELRFSYRHSLLKENKFIILLDAILSFQRKNSHLIDEELKSLIDIRRASQPIGQPSLGSTFKRCADVPVSKLIDVCGLKGHCIGGAKVSERHAGFIVNVGGATSNDYNNLVAYIKDRIFQKYGLRIEEEIERVEFLPRKK